jgi:putative transmembrane protein PGPGW
MKRGLRSAYRSLPRPLRRVSALLLGMGMLVAGLAMLVLPGPGLLVLGLAVAVLALEMELGSGLASPRITAGEPEQKFGGLVMTCLGRPRSVREVDLGPARTVEDGPPSGGPSLGLSEAASRGPSLAQPP